MGRVGGAYQANAGYGYLSENADFAMAVGSAGMLFVGPSAESIAALGNKVGAYNLLPCSVPFLQPCSVPFPLSFVSLSLLCLPFSLA